MVTVSPSGPPGLFKGVTTAMSGVLARFPWLLPVRNPVAGYGASGSSRLGIEPKTPGWLVQDPTTRPIGDLIPTIGGSGAHPWRGWDP